MYRKILLSSPYWLTAISILNVPIEFFFGAFKPHLFGLVLLILLLGVRFFVKDATFNRREYPLFLYVAIVVCLIPLSIRPGIDTLPVVLGGLSYIMYPIYWYLYIKMFGMEFNIERYSIFIILLGLLISIIGIYQYHVDISLNGIAVYINFTYAKEYLAIVQMRPSSIVASVQDYGLLMILVASLVAARILSKWKNKKYYVLIFIIVLYAAFLSGNKLVILGFFVLVLVFVKNKWGSGAAILVFVVMVLGAFALFYILSVPMNREFMEKRMPQLARMLKVAMDFSTALEEEAIRFNIYAKVLNGTNVFIGHGFGTSNSYVTNIFGVPRFATESYVWQLYYEGGAPLLLAFMFFLFSGMFSAEVRKQHLNIVLAVNMIGLLFVQSFISTSFIFVWGFFMLGSVSIRNGTRRVSIRESYEDILDQLESANR